MYPDLKYFLLFAGWPASGHSIIGSVLDAHEHIVVAHEFPIDQIFTAQSSTKLFANIANHSQEQGKKKGRVSIHDFNIDNPWAGIANPLHVIGSKNGGQLSLKVNEDHTSLERVQKVSSVPLKILIVTRNPYDNIAAMYTRYHQPNGRPFLYAVDRYVMMARAVEYIMSHYDTYVVKLEDFICKPALYTKQILWFVDEECPQDYMETWQDKIYEEPRLARGRILWSSQMIEAVNQVLERFSFLNYDYITPA